MITFVLSEKPNSFRIFDENFQFLIKSCCKRKKTNFLMICKLDFRGFWIAKEGKENENNLNIEGEKEEKRRRNKPILSRSIEKRTHIQKHKS